MHSQSDNTMLPEEVRAMKIDVESCGHAYTARATLSERSYAFTALRRPADTESDVVERLERRVCRAAATDAGWPVVCGDSVSGFFFGARDATGRLVEVENSAAKEVIAAGSIRAARPLAEKLMRL